jgi:DNA-binding transcriptional MerR regulator
MADIPHALILWRTEHGLLTLEDLATAAGLQPDFVEGFVNCGLIEPAAEFGSRSLFLISSVDRLQQILRVRHDLGVNLAGVAVILEMTDRIESLQREVQSLRAQLR